MDDRYIRKVQTSVTCFLHCGDEYLFLKRSPHKRVDANRLNGVGGRLEPGEDYLQAAIRETEEETGYVVGAADISLAAVGKLEGGYDEDWIMCFFKIAVPHKDIPGGNAEEDGELLWLHKDGVLDSGHELVDDLNYCFKEIAEGGGPLFFNAKVNDGQKIESIAISRLA